MANTFELISSYTASGSVGSITFSSIASTYTDLCIVVSSRTDRAAVPDYIGIKPNGSSANLSLRILEGYNGSVSSGTDTYIYGYCPGASATASTFGNMQFYIPNYRSSNYKSVSVESNVENNASTGGNWMTAGLWSNTAAITSVVLYPVLGSNFVQYSTAYLYGVKNA
jgi:hypothetical protein